VKTTKGKGVGTCSLARNTLGVEGHAGAARWNYDEWQANQLLTQICTNQTTSWLMYSWNTFRAWMNHGQTQTHKTHHGLDLGEATTFPLIVLFMLGHEANTQMSFCPKASKFLKFDSHNFGGP
jgi:hypothetical protein